MKVLIVKTSSMGDVIHCLPAVTDLAREIPGVEIDWVVEEGFADIVRLHPAVSRVIPLAIRRWRKSWIKHRAEVSQFFRQLRDQHYDVVIDSQGLVKSAIVALLSKTSKGRRSGFDRTSAREPLASLSYGNRFQVDRAQHAILRQRQLFAASFGYEIGPEFSYGLEFDAQKRHPSNQQPEARKSIFFLHGTTWASKHWPEASWGELAGLLTSRGYGVKLTYSNEVEHDRVNRIQSLNPDTEVIAPTSLQELARLLSECAGAVSVDTGLGHLAAACNLPLVGLYGPTSPELTGFLGGSQTSLAAKSPDCAPCLKAQCRFKQGEHSSNIYPPCFAEHTPETVFLELQRLMVAAQ